MRTLLKFLGTALLFVAVAICFAPTLIPPFLDRIYSQGPESGHFDGERFFNPDTTGVEEAAHAGGRSGFLARFLTGDRARWPDQVAVRRSAPPAHVSGDEMLVTWIGHATVLVQTQGLNILTDPIWSERASPFSFVGPKRVRAPGVAFDDLPKIDLVLISHNHYDHMDVATLKQLWDRDRPLIVTSLGNETILRKEGIGSSTFDWGGGMAVFSLCEVGARCPGTIDVTVERNHHWSSRWGADRNRALWSAFTVRLPGGNIFFAGDTGWGDGRWVREAAARGPVRLAIIPIGAYEPRDFMKTNHVNPEEAVRMFEALDPAAALGVHWGTFQLTFEGINDPPQRLDGLRRKLGIPADRFRTVEAGESFRIPAR